jgi:tetratricopeptide (TPR) repeat protein
LHAQLGALEASAEAARQALDLARKAEDKKSECNSLVSMAWAVHLQGDMVNAEKLFAQAETLEREIDSAKKYLYGTRDIPHAEHLRRSSKFDYAGKVIKANIEVATRMHIAFHLTQCYRVLGDLEFDSGNHQSARAHYESALKIARSISYRQVLIEALLARGRFYAKVAVGATRSSQTKTSVGIEGSPLQDAFTDLNEALNYAVEGGYRIYEADTRVALAWAYLANGEKEKAKQSAQHALQMSQEMGYHWGKVDAEEVLSVIASEG